MIDINEAINQLNTNTYYRHFDEDVKDILRESNFLIEIDTTVQNKISLLASNVSFPKFDVTVQKIWFQGRTIDKPIIKDISDKSFTIDFYQDELGALYSYFLSRLNAIDKYSAYSGTASNNFETLSIIQTKFDTDKVSYKVNFRDTFVKNIQQSKNDTSSDALSIITVTFGFTGLNVFAEGNLLSFNDITNIGDFIALGGMDLTLNGYIENNIHAMLGNSVLGNAIDNNFGDLLDDFIENFTGDFGGITLNGIRNDLEKYAKDGITTILDGII